MSFLRLIPLLSPILTLEEILVQATAPGRLDLNPELEMRTCLWKHLRAPLPEPSHVGRNPSISFISTSPRCRCLGRLPLALAGSPRAAGPHHVLRGPPSLWAAHLVPPLRQLLLGCNHSQIHDGRILQTPDWNTGHFPDFWGVENASRLYDFI